MKQKYNKKPKEHTEIALERINTLFEQAEQQFPKDPKLSDKYVELARKIAMKTKVRIPRELKRRFCKHCHSYLKQGVNCRVRMHDGKAVYHCQVCKQYMRFPFTKEQKAKRKKT